MSSKVQEKKSAGTTVTHEERWRSGRPRFLAGRIYAVDETRSGIFQDSNPMKKFAW